MLGSLGPPKTLMKVKTSRKRRERENEESQKRDTHRLPCNKRTTGLALPPNQALGWHSGGLPKPDFPWLGRREVPSMRAKCQVGSVVVARRAPFAWAVSSQSDRLLLGLSCLLVVFGSTAQVPRLGVICWRFLRWGRGTSPELEAVISWRSPPAINAAISTYLVACPFQFLSRKKKSINHLLVEQIRFLRHLPAVPSSTSSPTCPTQTAPSPSSSPSSWPDAHDELSKNNLEPTPLAAVHLLAAARQPLQAVLIKRLSMILRVAFVDGISGCRPI